MAPQCNSQERSAERFGEANILMFSCRPFACTYRTNYGLPYYSHLASTKPWNLHQHCIFECTVVEWQPSSTYGTDCQQSTAPADSGSHRCNYWRGDYANLRDQARITSHLAAGPCGARILACRVDTHVDAR